MSARRPSRNPMRIRRTAEVTYTAVMSVITPRASRHRSRHLGIVLLLVVVAALGMVHITQPLHLHHGTSAGLYNEEHILAALDSVTGDAPLPAGLPGVGIDLAPTAAPFAAGVAPAAPVVRNTQSRAPPLA
jgi:hypothetical protein